MTRPRRPAGKHGCVAQSSISTICAADSCRVTKQLLDHPRAQQRSEPDPSLRMRKHVEGDVPIRSLKIFNQDTAASQYRTENSRKNEQRSIRRSTRKRPRLGFGTALVPLSRPHFFPGPLFLVGNLAVAILRRRPPSASPQDEGLFHGEILDPHGEEAPKAPSRTMRPGIIWT
jgi:hypothetical protein